LEGANNKDGGHHGRGRTTIIEKIEEHRQYLQRGLIFKRSLENAEAELVEAIRDKVTRSVIERLKREKLEEILMQKESWTRLRPLRSSSTRFCDEA
jgi:putative protein kinase ArgK-like GTPase of G3E family